MKLRDLAVIIEENRDAELEDIAAALNALRIETRDLFYADYPEAKERLEKLKNG